MAEPSARAILEANPPKIHEARDSYGMLCWVVKVWSLYNSHYMMVAERYSEESARLILNEETANHAEYLKAFAKTEAAGA